MYSIYILLIYFYIYKIHIHIQMEKAMNAMLLFTPGTSLGMTLGGRREAMDEASMQ